MNAAIKIQHDQWSPIRINDSYALDHFNKSHESVLSLNQKKNQFESVKLLSLNQSGSWLARYTCLCLLFT